MLAAIGVESIDDLFVQLARPAAAAQSPERPR